MKEETEAGVIRITPHILGRAVGNFQCQLQMVLDASGSHTEHVFLSQVYHGKLYQNHSCALSI
jgi:hypothetical protein